MVDGVHFAETCCVVALGIDIDGTKHPLALVEGSTENATVVTELLAGAARSWPGRHPADLRRHRRGEGAAEGGGDVFDHPVIRRCQLHKIRNVEDKLPERPRRHRGSKMRVAYHADDGAGRRGRAAGPGPGARPHPPRRRRVACARAWRRR